MYRVAPGAVQLRRSPGPRAPARLTAALGHREPRRQEGRRFLPQPAGLSGAGGSVAAARCRAGGGSAAAAAPRASGGSGTHWCFSAGAVSAARCRPRRAAPSRAEPQRPCARGVGGTGDGRGEGRAAAVTGRAARGRGGRGTANPSPAPERWPAARAAAPPRPASPSADRTRGARGETLLKAHAPEGRTKTNSAPAAVRGCGAPALGRRLGLPPWWVRCLVSEALPWRVR